MLSSKDCAKLVAEILLLEEEDSVQCNEVLRPTEFRITEGYYTS